MLFTCSFNQTTPVPAGLSMSTIVSIAISCVSLSATCYSFFHICFLYTQNTYYSKPKVWPLWTIFLILLNSLIVHCLLISFFLLDIFYATGTMSSILLLSMIISFSTVSLLEYHSMFPSIIQIMKRHMEDLNLLSVSYLVLKMAFETIHGPRQTSCLSILWCFAKI